MGSHPELYHKGLDYTISFGKYKGKTLKEICEKEPGYIEFLSYKLNFKMKKEVYHYKTQVQFPIKP